MHIYANDQLLESGKKYNTNLLDDFELEWEALPDTFYTLYIYDNTINLVHALIVNIPNNEIDKGDVILPYIPPNPPGTSKHRYIFNIYKQHRHMRTFEASREDFDLEDFIDSRRLDLVGSKVINATKKTFSIGKVGKSNVPKDTRKTRTPRKKRSPTTPKVIRTPRTPRTPRKSEEVEFNSEHPLIKPDTSLSEKEQRYCSCVAKVKAKQTDECILHGKGKGCVNNIYAVCAKTVGTTSRKCSENYNFDAFSERQLHAHKLFKSKENK